MGLFSSKKTQKTTVETTSVVDVEVNPINNITIDTQAQAQAARENLASALQAFDGFINRIVGSGQDAIQGLSNGLSGAGGNIGGGIQAGGEAIGDGIEGAGVNIAFGLFAAAGVTALAIIAR